MSSIFSCGFVPTVCGQMPFPAAGVRGKFNPDHSIVLGRSRLPEDAIGTFTLRLTNIVVGSRYRISRTGDNSLATPSGVAEGVAGATTIDITLDLYAAGNSNNDLAIDVRKGTSATKYLPFRTQATAQSGTVLAYISQVADTIA